jgi:hypothetical protein
MADYSLQILKFLDADALAGLRNAHMPQLMLLNTRYTPHIDVERAFPITPIYIDFLRFKWRFDEDKLRPLAEVVTSGLGFAFGMLLGTCTKLRWCKAEDAEGEFLTMGWRGEGPEAISVPPFSFVAKRHDVENAEVFQDFFSQISAESIGFVRPRNWLLDE